MRLTSRLLRKFVKEEAEKLREKPIASAEETDADELADALEKQIDYLHALKIEEHRLIRRLNRIRENKAILRNKLYKKRV